MNRYAIALALSLCGGHVHANDGNAGPLEQPSFAEDKSAWILQVTPYLWAAGLKGHISPFQDGPTMDVEKSFSDVMHDFNVGGFINVWGRRDRFVFSADMMYVNTTDGHGKGPLPAFQLPNLGIAIPPGANVEAKVNSKQFTATLQGGYRVLDTSDLTLDVLGGARFWHISNDVVVTASHQAIGTRTARHGEDFSWVDPLLGMRAFMPLSKNSSMQMQADIGGFGAGSRQTWSALATFNYVWSNRLSASAGYKVLNVDYDHGGHVYDIRLHGPAFGFTYRF